MPLTLPPDIEPPIVLPTVSPEVFDDTDNVKVNDPPPLVNIPSNDAKVVGVPPLVVPPPDAYTVVAPVVVSIDNQ
jgi:hypothetical protein